MKGLPCPFDPGTSWAIPAFPGLGNAGPHWPCFLLPIIFMASSVFFTYSVLSKGNGQEVGTGFQKRKGLCIWWGIGTGLTSWMVLMLLTASYYPCSNSGTAL